MKKVVGTLVVSVLVSTSVFAQGGMGQTEGNQYSNTYDVGQGSTVYNGSQDTKLNSSNNSSEAQTSSEVPCTFYAQTNYLDRMDEWSIDSKAESLLLANNLKVTRNPNAAFFFVSFEHASEYEEFFVMSLLRLGNAEVNKRTTFSLVRSDGVTVLQETLSGFISDSKKAKLIGKMAKINFSCSGSPPPTL